MGEPMNPGDRIQLYLDDARVGSGYRRFLVLEIGRKWVTLFHLPSLSKLRLAREEIERNPTFRIVDGNRRTLRRLIRDTAKTRRRLGLSYSDSGAKQALELLT